MSVINAPTETSNPPTMSAFACPIATRASGSVPLEPSSLLRLYEDRKSAVRPAA